MLCPNRIVFKNSKIIKLFPGGIKVSGIYPNHLHGRRFSAFLFPRPLTSPSDPIPGLANDSSRFCIKKITKPAHDHHLQASHRLTHSPPTEKRLLATPVKKISGPIGCYRKATLHIAHSFFRPRLTKN